jgi:hypothetical protein
MTAKMRGKENLRVGFMRALKKQEPIIHIRMENNLGYFYQQLIKAQFCLSTQ